MTALRASVNAAVLAAGIFLLPLQVPLPSPSPPQIIGTPLATPSLPGVLPTAAASAPAVATPGATAAPSAAAASPPVVQASAAPLAAAPAAAAPRRSISIPFTGIYVASPIDAALIVALMSLPLLLAIWLLLFGRTFTQARRVRDAHTRLMLAADLGLHPRDVGAMSTKALFDLREKAAFDELTGVLRRAAGIGAAEREIARARRRNAPLAVAFIDVDGLKETNDQSGHEAGDALLRGLVDALKQGLRGEDIVLRYGGDEFVLILPDTAARAARALLAEIQSEAARAGVRFCAGVAELGRSDDVVSLFARADRDLYEFKANRGQIVQLPPAGGRTQDKPKEDRITRA